MGNMSGTQNTRMYGDVDGKGQMNSISSLSYLQEMEQIYDKINIDRKAFGRKVGNPSTWDKAAENDREFEADLNEYKKNVLDYEKFLINDLEYAFPYGVYNEMVAGCYIHQVTIM